MVLDIALHDANGPVRIKDISKRLGISVKYLEKLIRTLKKSGFIESKRGPKGGHKLAMDPSRISVGALVRLLEGNRAIVTCVEHTSACHKSQDCLTRRIWAEAGKAMFEVLDEMTLDKLLDDIEGNGGDVHDITGPCPVRV